MDKPGVLKPLAISAAMALIVLIVAVLPAEYGVDPTGFGRVTGLVQLDEPSSEAHQVQDHPPATVTVKYTLQPYESLEYKLVMQDHSALVYSWFADGELEFDLHAEPDDGPEGFAESFSVGAADSEAGSHVAPFAGEHGWYWQNRTPAPVTLDLTATGFFSTAIEYRDGRITSRSVGEAGKE